MPLVDSLEVDFEHKRWHTEILGSPRMGAGLYLCVPVLDAQEAGIIEDTVRGFRKPGWERTPEVIQSEIEAKYALGFPDQTTDGQ